jgi:hypothetical protein
LEYTCPLSFQHEITKLITDVKRKKFLQLSLSITKPFTVERHGSVARVT